ncbi:hypothetical protein BKP42_41610 [Rhodococcus erythropolis]|uniref:hypothetical protein n=1 Tax=Rhodococcus erythropolis TaxID=1833 RepID=UPI001553B813|nr:hypothetical protein [Rhodococcus erythropolis]PBI96478.1 hypothetical protein BKP42_41610 [Rhodococcus erythropolis]
MAKSAAPTSATNAYGMGATLRPEEARRLAKALDHAADQVDPQSSGGAFSIPLG